MLIGVLAKLKREKQYKVIKYSLGPSYIDDG